MEYTNTKHGFGFNAEHLNLGLLIPSVTIIENDKSQKATVLPENTNTTETEHRIVNTFIGKGSKKIFKTESNEHILKWNATETNSGIIFKASYTNKTDKTVYLHSFNLTSSTDNKIELNGDPSDWILDAKASITDKPITHYDLLTERYAA